MIEVIASFVKLNAPNQPTMEVQKKMWEILTTFSPETQEAIFKKCEDLNFNPDRGEITLKESFINLNESARILKDSIKKNQISQLPLSIQKELHNNVERIQAFQQNLVSGTDEIINIVNAIEELFANIWRYGLNNMSIEVLGYAEKMNQLKTQELQAQNLQEELEKGLKLKKDLEDILTEIQQKVNSLTKIETQANEQITTIEELKEKGQEIHQTAVASLATIQQNESTSTHLAASSKTSDAEIQSLLRFFKEFGDKIEVYKNEMSTTAQFAAETLGNNTSQTETLVSGLRKLEEQIKDQLQKATGFSLFHSFQTRQANLVKSRDRWMYAILALVGISVAATFLIAHYTSAFDIVSIPVPIDPPFHF